MLFCEKCNLMTRENVCPCCGSKKLRDVQADDFCFFISLDEFRYSMLETALKEESIDVVGIPFYPNGVTYANAGRASGRKVYVRYKDRENSKEIYRTLFGGNKEN